MRKIYFASLLTLLAASQTVSAAAADGNVSERKLTSTLAKVDADDDEWETIGEGTFSDPVVCNEFSGYYNDPVSVTVQRSKENPAVYRVLDPWPNIAEFWPSLHLRPDDNFMIIDTTDPEFVLVKEGALPFDDAVNGEVRYMSMTQFAADRGFTKEMFLQSPLAEGIVTMPEEGYIKFTRNCFGVMYPDGVTNPAGTWMPTMGDYSGYLVLPGGTAAHEWDYLGTGQMLDGFVWTVFEEEPPQEKDVEVYEFAEAPYIYKIVGAFTDTYEGAADLIIDATDPNWVRITQFDTRIKTASGQLHILSVSANGYESYEHMVAFTDHDKHNITLKDNYIDIPAQSIYLMFPDVNNAEVVVNNLALPSYIKLPGYTGVENVSVDDSAPAYFNIMGQPVKNPAAGQIVIERRGSKTTKKLIK